MRVVAQDEVAVDIIYLFTNIHRPRLSLLFAPMLGYIASPLYFRYQALDGKICHHLRYSHDLRIFINTLLISANP